MKTIIVQPVLDLLTRLWTRKGRCVWPTQAKGAGLTVLATHNRYPLSGTVFVALATGMIGIVEPAQGRDIYVAPNGNDAAPGNINNPLRTIQKAVDQAAEGDCIRLRDGIYRSDIVTLNSGGSADNPLVLEGMPGESAIIKGSQVVTNWKLHSPGIWKIADWKINSQQLFVDGHALQQIGDQCRWHHEKVWANQVCLPPVGKDLVNLKPGSYYYDKAAKVLYCMLMDQTDPNSRLMEASVVNVVLHGSGRSHVILRNLTFMHSNNTADGDRQGVVRVDASGWLIEDCRINFGDFAGLAMSGQQHTVRRCQISNNGGVGIDLNGSDESHQYQWYPARAPMEIVLEDLELSGNNYRDFNNQWHAGGMKCIPCCRGVTVRRCRIFDNRGPGIWFDSSLGNIRIEDNLLVGNITGIFYEISAPAQGDSFGARIYNNRVVRSRNQGIYIAASSGAIVENNTCHQNHWDIVLHGMPRKEVTLGKRHLENNRIRNNIVSSSNIGVVVFVGDDARKNEVDGNFYAIISTLQPVSSRISVTRNNYDDGVCTDLKQAFKEHGYEGCGLMGNVEWMDASKLDFRLKVDSRAVGKGWQSTSASP